ncbi:MAG TPA: alkaline phosphatase D family protein [Acidimicrobiales bacterium]
MIGRRAFLAGVVAAAVAAGCSGGSADGDTAGPAGSAGGEAPPETAADLPPLPPSLPAELFALGVASGDPLPESVILWTRLVNDPLADGGGLPDQPLPVRWEVAADEAFDDIVASGDAVAEPALAHSVHIDASGLEPDTWYWYRFAVGEHLSPVGRTRTAPGGGEEVERLRFAFASCQSYQEGFWTAHEHLAGEDIDLVVFLGDYIYEYEPDPTGVRTHETDEPFDLAGYRRRYGEYKVDPALQSAHAHVPWVCTWDDHEVDGNYAADVPSIQDGAPGGRRGFRDRRAAAYQAYYEHLPLRIEAPDGPEVTLYRSLGWGDLARFYVVDGRQYRSDQACGRSYDVGLGCDEVADDDRTMLGDEQEAWLGDELAGSDATWNVLAQQTVMSKVTVPLGRADGLNLDQWDGYPAARRRLVDMLREVDNPVVISGDFHASGVGVVTDDPDDASSPPLVPELVGTSISSEFPGGLVELAEAVVAASPNLRYVEARRRGYVVCEVTHHALDAAFRYVSTVAAPVAELSTGARWSITAGDPEPRPA